MIKKRGLNSVIVFLLLCFGFLIYKIYYIFIIKGAEYKAMADSQYEYSVKSCEMNYVLMDSNGDDLMKYKEKYYVDLVPPDFFYNDVSSSNYLTLVYTLKNYNKQYDISKMREEIRKAPLSYEIDENTYNKLKDINTLKGMYAYNFKAVDRGSAWKIENMLSSPYNSGDSSKKANNSIEMEIFNRIKDNQGDRLLFTKDVNRNIIVSQEKQDYDRIDVQLTIDKKKQNEIKNIICNDRYKQYGQIGVLLMESDTGKIKAMVQKDDTLPNVNTSLKFYPGSIFKTIVAEAALDTNTLKPNEIFKCNGNYESNEHKLHGKLNIENAFAVSCNDIFAQVGNKVGADNIIEYARKQGVFDTVLGIENEEKGMLDDAKPSSSNGTLSLTSIGQNIRITPLEAISIVNTVVTGGVYVKPYIINGYISEGKLLTENRNKSYRVMKNSTADIIKQYMDEVIKKGTGKFALVKGVNMGGKTGTTERLGSAPGDILKSSKRSDGWFIGYFKMKNKYYSMVVFVQDIDTNCESGGTTAAIIFKDVVETCTKNIKK